MDFLVDNIQVNADEDQNIELILKKTFAQQVKFISHTEIIKKSIDARDKASIKIVYTIKISAIKKIVPTQKSIKIKTFNSQPIPALAKKAAIPASTKPIIVGMGPAGLFCALRLIEHGITPVLIERGKAIEDRSADVGTLWATGSLDQESNPLFGEGGAGTFSDGKLTTQINDPMNNYILRALTDFGAPPEIIYESKPHIGTDNFTKVLTGIRTYLKNNGAQISFSTRLVDIETHENKLKTAILSDGSKIETGTLFLAIGHSAHDTYKNLIPKVAMEPKPFAVGFRVEHPQELINAIQYGEKNSNNLNLGAATYKLTHQTSSNRHVFSFCMCPGGKIICSSNQPERLVLNGMSNHSRNSGFANSALVVNIMPEDFYLSSPLDGLDFIANFEKKAYSMGRSNFAAPAQNLLDFIANKTSPELISSTYKPGLMPADLRSIYPEFVNLAILEALPIFDRRMKGFITKDAILIGVETRTSSPIRITRQKNGEHIDVRGLYPIGEGAGYAGGIMSAALDGIKAADNYVNSLS